MSSCSTTISTPSSGGATIYLDNSSAILDEFSIKSSSFSSPYNVSNTTNSKASFFDSFLQ